MDMASTLATLHAGILTPEQAKTVANGIQSNLQWAAERPASERPTDYLEIQGLLYLKTGSDGSRMHSGRSRQDMLATLHRLLLRDRLLRVSADLIALRTHFLAQAARHPDAIVPSYTNGVQAQPVLLAHQLLGYESALARSSRRLIEVHRRLNRSPLGAAALATSRFALDRPLLARLLGFDAPVDNTFDAAQLAVVDTGVECAQTATLPALQLGMFAQDLQAQFHHARPWILLGDPDLSSPSTLMPQKRNPVALNRIRLLGSQIIGASATAVLAAHNVASGMTDYKRADASHALDLCILLLDQASSVVRSLRVDPDAALEQLHAEYTTTSELAASLQERVNLPLSVAHEFASQLVKHARAQRASLRELPFSDVTELYDQTLVEARQADHSHFDLSSLPANGLTFPFTEAEFHGIIHPRTMVDSYKGTGGSSPQEVERMQGEASAAASRDQEELSVIQLAQSAAEQELGQRFEALLA